MATDTPQVTSISEWKKGKTNEPQPLTLPSGKTCLCRAVGVEAFLAQGLIPNSLISILQKQIEKGRKGVQPDQPAAAAEAISEADADKMLEELMADPARLAEVIGMADALTVFCVIEPTVNPLPENEADRKQELLYVDEVDLDDKFYIMAFALGGTRDLEGFREATGSGVANLPARKASKRPAKRAGGAKRK